MLLALSIVTVLAGLAVSRRERETGLMAVFVGAVTGLFTLGFAIGHFT